MWDETVWLDNIGRNLIEQFWQAYGEEAAFPRNLEQALALALPVILVKFPRLKLREAERWLQSRGKSSALIARAERCAGAWWPSAGMVTSLWTELTRPTSNVLALLTKPLILWWITGIHANKP